MKEAAARIKINRLLEAAGWRFFPDGKLPANIQLEPQVTIKESDLNALGEDFEKTTKGFIDFLLLNEKGFPLIILEAKVSFLPFPRGWEPIKCPTADNIPERLSS